MNTLLTSMDVKQWSRKMIILVCSVSEILSLLGAAAHSRTRLKNPGKCSGFIWNVVQAGTLSLNFSFTMTTMDLEKKRTCLISETVDFRYQLT